MTVYMLVLLVATLGVVWIVIDQVTARALAAREAAGADKINATYQERCRNERERIDQTLLQQAKELGNAMHLHAEPWFRAEFAKYAVQATTAQLIFGPSPAPGLGPNLMTGMAWTAYGYAPPTPSKPSAWWFGSAAITPRVPRSPANGSASCGECGRFWCLAAAPALWG